MSEKKVLFTVLSGIVLTYTTVYICMPFEKFEVKKSSLTFGLAGFVGVSILGYYLVEYLLNDVLSKIKVDLYDDNTLVFSLPHGEILRLTPKV